MVQRFEEKIVVITGAAGGIGRATAQRLASEGARIVAVDLPGSDLEATLAVVAEAGSEGIAVRADVSRRAEADLYVAAAIEAYGRIDAFFNNAGIEGRVMPLMEYLEDEWDRVQAVNVKGVLFGIQAVGRQMRSSGGGAIVNTASIAGLGAAGPISAYGASKHAVISITKNAALELASDGIRVNAIAPAPIDTPMLASLERQMNPDDPDAVHRGMAANSPLGRIGTPADVAASVAFLLSDDAAFLTGTVLGVDGGSRAR